QAGDVSGGLVTADDLNVSASGAIDLSTAVASVTALSGTSIDIDESDAVTLTSVRSGNGAIDVEAGGSITAESVVSVTDSDTNDISLTSTGGGISIGTEVRATGAGDVILDAQAGDVSGGLVTADDLNVSASGAIDLSTAVASVTALSGTSIDLVESDAVTLISVRSGNGAIDVEAGGSITAESVVSV
ncbi:MAG: hypothetical protein GY797_11295, partial [Deltaproteobacteria bacterium]|nr:hypothetical protein [Deltaproteobacteria bacterium]